MEGSPWGPEVGDLQRFSAANKGEAEGQWGQEGLEGSRSFRCLGGASTRTWNGRLDPEATQAVRESCNSLARGLILTNKTWQDVGRIIFGLCRVRIAKRTNPCQKQLLGN